MGNHHTVLPLYYWLFLITNYPTISSKDGIWVYGPQPLLHVSRTCYRRRHCFEFCDLLRAFLSCYWHAHLITGKRRLWKTNWNREGIGVQRKAMNPCVLYSRYTASSKCWRRWLETWKRGFQVDECRERWDIQFWVDLVRLERDIRSQLGPMWEIQIACQTNHRRANRMIPKRGDRGTEWGGSQP